MKRLMLVLVAMLIIGCALTIITGFKSQKGSTAPSVTTPASTPPNRQRPSPPAAATAPPAHIKKQGMTAHAAANAAAFAHDNLTAALFLDDNTRTDIINQLVAPNMRGPQINTHKAQMQAYAYLWGYGSDDAAIQQAASYSSYYTYVKKYHVDSFSGDRATVRLYYVTSWTQPATPACPATSGYCKVKAPRIDTVRMVYIDGRWLYAGGSSAPAGQMPPNKSFGSYQVAVRAYRPYQEGFTRYEPVRGE